MRINKAAFQAACALAMAVLTGCGTPNTVLRQRGEESLARRDYPQAYQFYARAVQQDPTDHQSQIQLGRLLMRDKRWFDAMLVWQHAWALRPGAPETPMILDNLAESIFQQGDKETLYRMLQKAADDYQTSADFLRQGGYMAKIGDVDAAEVAFRKAVHFARPDDPEPYVASSAFYELIGDRARAATALRRAYAISPGDVEIRSRLRHYGIVPGPTVAMPAEPKGPPPVAATPPAAPPPTAPAPATAEPAPVPAPAEPASVAPAPVPADPDVVVPPVIIQSEPIEEPRQ